MLAQIVRNNKGAVTAVLLFTLLENVAWIIEPTFFGKLLDALIDDFYKDEHVNYMLPLFIWIIIYLFNVVGGTLSRLLSGKVYARIYADVATEVILKSKKNNHPITKMLARAELAKEYIVFLKDRIPEVLWQLSASIGGIIALFFYDWRIAGISVLVIFPIVLINNVYRKHVSKLQKTIHDTREEMNEVLEGEDTSRINEYYHSMVLPQSKIAKWSSFDYGIVKVLLMIIFIVVLFICVDVDKFTTGKIYAIVSYLWTFIASTEYLPGLMESLTSVKDLNTRMKEEVVEVLSG
ncbi:MAG: ABC transporter six-transmembrane domain-containing protein [Bacteroidia bacterium]|nr:ABC transporter six-transmembrane domain-containing protein [Bacteroidia bacterium]